jgi:hypothetical protein
MAAEFCAWCDMTKAPNTCGMIYCPHKEERNSDWKQATKRPANYEKLSPREQWEIDKELGILDWDGE